MTKWIREHIATVSVLLAILGAILLGVVIGGTLAFISGFWLAVSGGLDGMVLASWGYQ